MSVGKTQGIHSGVECQPCIEMANFTESSKSK